MEVLTENKMGQTHFVICHSILPIWHLPGHDEYTDTSWVWVEGGVGVFFKP